ncbi:uncharacterized protein LOC141904930 [Tubulanus polymorphus]|uniref:uncharacterized protein LOC141904735 n=1 Tax=Tubulanus polymorphus TaxID=672921 RepID=UPI003DA315B6
MNPHEPEKKIYFVICPSHQLKNQINQLWASQTGGTKNFMNGVEFGWDEIKSMWNRETQRRDDNHIRMVPGLIKSYIERDSWTKLNVKPAKIMQQPQVLVELYSYANPDNSPIPLESEHVMATRSFLVACSQLFEEGLLKSRKPNDMTRNSQIHDMESPIILNISEGYKYVRDWCEYLHHEFADEFQMISPSQKKFISWQTYDLLRVMVFGFIGFCKDYLTEFPGYCITPLTVNGSAVETLFSQFKHCVGGKLTSLNYPQAR